MPVAKKSTSKKVAAQKQTITKAPVIMTTVINTPSPQATSTIAPMMTTSVPPSQQAVTTISPIMMTTETPAIVVSNTNYPNINFSMVNIQPNVAQFIYTDPGSYARIDSWDVSTSMTLNSPLSITSEPTQNPASFLIGTGTGGKFKFIDISTISPFFTKYGIIQYRNDSYDGNYDMVLSYNAYFGAVGNYLLTYYIQSRPLKYNQKQTIKASINNFSTEAYAFGASTSGWQKQELVFTITEVKAHLLTFTSSLSTIGFVDSSIAFGGITIEPITTPTPAPV